MNAVIDGPGARWALAERGRAALARAPGSLAIGASRIDWDGTQLLWRVDERCAPFPRRLRGEVRLTPLLTPARRFDLDPDGAHTWRPLAPRARVSVRLEQPRLSWEGEAYLDCNRGARALEQDFTGWSWSRAPVRGGARVYYEVQHRRERCAPLALQFEPDGSAWSAPLLPLARLPRSGWGLARGARSEKPAGTRLLRTMLDAPFYVRSRIETQLGGECVPLVHERLDLARFSHPLVQWMLPFRISRPR